MKHLLFKQSQRMPMKRMTCRVLVCAAAAAGMLVCFPRHGEQFVLLFVDDFTILGLS